jgi:glutamyl-tRNA(Gln) amidotransferase subunit E
MNGSDPTENYEQTRQRVRYVPRREAPPELYERLGFRCGLEIHQQLKTEKKLFCRCPAGLYQDEDKFDAQLVRHMRPTLSELGEYDGTALMEFRTKKNIIYRIKGETACTYDIDDTPPFPLNRDALAIAMEIALLLKASIVGELHVTRKQYLDGSIPTGFQRTAIVGIDGEIPLAKKTVRIIQISIEEDSCREVSDVGHERVYTTDRLGIPLVEAVTYPDMTTPDEAAEAANYIRYLTRSTGRVNVGIGAARQDVNVSITGGTRVEIKGVQHIRWIPELTHNEAFRQKALLEIREALRERVADPAEWKIRTVDVDPVLVPGLPGAEEDFHAVAVNLPGFIGLLSFFTSPGRSFADELSDRLRVIACLEMPNMTHSEALDPILQGEDWEVLRSELGAKPGDAQVLLWGPAADIPTAIETIEERCLWAFEGVPNETRKALPDGTTLFERVLPGPDRMYPDTDSAPIPITEGMIDAARADLPDEVAARLERLRGWGVPEDAHPYILRRNLFPLLRSLIDEHNLPSTFAGTLIGHALRSACGDSEVDGERLLWLVGEVQARNLCHDLLTVLVPLAYRDGEASFDTLLKSAGYALHTEAEIIDRIPELEGAFHVNSSDTRKMRDWIMGRLRPLALGNVPLHRLAAKVEERL